MAIINKEPEQPQQESEQPESKERSSRILQGKQRIQTAEGWKRSMVKKSKKNKNSIID